MFKIDKKKSCIFLLDSIFKLIIGKVCHIFPNFILFFVIFPLLSQKGKIKIISYK